MDQSSCWSYAGRGEAMGGQLVSWWNGEASQLGGKKNGKRKDNQSSFQSLNGL